MSRDCCFSHRDDIKYSQQTSNAVIDLCLGPVAKGPFIWLSRTGTLSYADAGCRFCRFVCLSSLFIAPRQANDTKLALLSFYYLWPLVAEQSNNHIWHNHRLWQSINRRAMYCILHTVKLLFILFATWCQRSLCRSPWYFAPWEEIC